MLRLLAGHCSEDSEQDHLLLLASKDGRDAYKTEVHPRNSEMSETSLQAIAVLLVACDFSRILQLDPCGRRLERNCMTKHPAWPCNQASIACKILTKNRLLAACLARSSQCHAQLHTGLDAVTLIALDAAMNCDA